MSTRRVSVARARRDLPRLLKESREADILIFNERIGTLAGALVSGDAYRRVSRLQAYLDALVLSDKTGHRKLRISDLIRRARVELEGRSTSRVRARRRRERRSQ